MNNDNLTTYSEWDLKLPEIPVRSRLYHLEPFGVGTPNVESLTSYVQRLASEHCVTTGKLIISEIALHDRGRLLTHKVESISQILGVDNSRTALNGTGLMAAYLVHALEVLTLRSDLRFLTLLFWEQVLPIRGLLRRFRAWCPTCYEQWRYTNCVIYEPLLWSIDAVKLCLHHCCLLSERCPHCQQQLVVITGCSRPGYCSHCHNWLGSFPPVAADEHKILSEHDLKWQTYVINNIGQLIAAAPCLSSIPTRERIAQAISAYINQLFQGNAAALAHQVGIQHPTLRQWLQGKAIPQMNNLLQLTHPLETSLLIFLSGEVLAAECIPWATSLQKQRQHRQRKPFKRLNLKDKQTLFATLTQVVKEEPPPSLEDVAQRVGYYPLVLQHHFPDLSDQIKLRHADYRKASQQAKIQPVLEAALNDAPPPSLLEIVRRLGQKNSCYLYKYFPSLSRGISKRYKEYLKACGVEKRERICQEIRQVALKLHAQGVEPTRHRVAVLLTKPGVLLSKYAQSVLQQVRCSLGYEK